MSSNDLIKIIETSDPCSSSVSSTSCSSELAVFQGYLVVYSTMCCNTISDLMSLNDLIKIIATRDSFSSSFSSISWSWELAVFLRYLIVYSTLLCNIINDLTSSNDLGSEHEEEVHKNGPPTCKANKGKEEKEGDKGKQNGDASRLSWPGTPPVHPSAPVVAHQNWRFS